MHFTIQFANVNFGFTLEFGIHHLQLERISIVKSETKMTSIQDLPPEMLANILKHVDSCTKKTCRSVCERWRSVLDYHMHKFDVLLDDSTVKYVLNCKNKVQFLTIGQLISTHLPISSTRNRKCFGSSAIVVFLKVISKENLVKILSQLQGLQYLTFTNYTLKPLRSDVAFWTRIQYLGLRQISISIEKYESGHHRAVGNLLDFAMFPRLDRFHLEFMRPFDTSSQRVLSYPAKPYYKLYPSIFQFLLRHKSTMKKVALITPASLTGFKVGTGMQFSQHLFAELRTVKFERLGINITEQEVGKTWSLARELLNAQDSLSNLVLMGRPLVQQDTGAIERNAATLVLLLWASTTASRNEEGQVQIQDEAPPAQLENPLYRIDMAVLHKCSQLSSLEIITSKPVQNLHLLPITLTKLCWSAMLSYHGLTWIAKNLVNLKKLALVAENYTEPGSFANIVPITLDVFIYDILRMEQLTELNLQCFCAAADIELYCIIMEAGGSGISCRPRMGLTITIDRAIYPPS